MIRLNILKSNTLFNYFHQSKRKSFKQFLRSQSAPPKSNEASEAAEISELENRTTHFGFQTLKESEKDKKVYQVFEDVAQSYDIMNDAMSIGVHRIWKDFFVERLGPTHGTQLLDMAGGTGDIAFRVIKYLNNQPNPHGKRSNITISDVNQHMLDVGKKRAENLLTTVKGDSVAVVWKCADAEKLPFENETFTTYTIAFGIRNCTHWDRVISEAYRVLKPGGRFMCLEFSHVTNSTLKWLYDKYSFQVIPPMGQILAGKWQPYQYLVESIRKVPKQEEFKAMIEAAGFDVVRYENLTFGIVSIHSGFKL